jgi:hypothetical protein
MNEIEIQKTRIDALEKQTAIQAARLERLKRNSNGQSAKCGFSLWP